MSTAAVIKSTRTVVRNTSVESGATSGRWNLITSTEAPLSILLYHTSSLPFGSKIKISKTESWQISRVRHSACPLRSLPPLSHPTHHYRTSLRISPFTRPFQFPCRLSSSTRPYNASLAIVSRICPFYLIFLLASSNSILQYLLLLAFAARYICSPLPFASPTRSFHSSLSLLFLFTISACHFYFFLAYSHAFLLVFVSSFYVLLFSSALVSYSCVLLPPTVLAGNPPSPTFTAFSLPLSFVACPLQPAFRLLLASFCFL